MKLSQISTKEILTNQITKPITRYLHPFSLICEHIGILRKETCILFIANKMNIDLSNDKFEANRARRDLLSTMFDNTTDLIASIPDASILQSIDCESDGEIVVIESLINMRRLLTKIQYHYTAILDSNSLFSPSQTTLNSLHLEAFYEVMTLNDAIFNLELKK